MRPVSRFVCNRVDKLVFFLSFAACGRGWGFSDVIVDTSGLRENRKKEKKRLCRFQKFCNFHTVVGRALTAGNLIYSIKNQWNTDVERKYCFR